MKGKGKGDLKLLFNINKSVLNWFPLHGNDGFLICVLKIVTVSCLLEFLIQNGCRKINFDCAKLNILLNFMALPLLPCNLVN